MKKYSQLIFVFSDIIFIAVSVLSSFILRFDGVIPAERWINLYSFFFLAAVVTLFVFFLRGLYKISWKYLSITDIPNIASAVLLSVLIISAGLFLFRDSRFFLGFPRSIVFIYFILVLFFSSALRFSKRFYLQIFKSGAVSFSLSEPSLPLSAEILEDKGVKNILVVGGAGYIGSVLCRKLLAEGYNVKILDKLLFGRDSIKEIDSNPHFEFIEGDIFDKDALAKAFFNVDAVVNLAAIVGEPACLCQKDVALRTNYLGAVYIARFCKTLGIRRFIQASTCSTYGQNENSAVSAGEKSKLLPVDFYGETKIYAERELMKLMDDNFNPTILRFSTVYGLSPRMRFDLVVNTLTKKAVKNGEITIFGGNQWRPLVHVHDAARAIILAIKSPLPKVANQIFNVGNNEENYTISDIGNLVKEIIPATKVKTIDSVEDKRNYKVNFSKIENALGFLPQKRVRDGIIEIKEAIERNIFSDIEDRKYYNHMIVQ